jgi:hypothetical protein
MIPTSFSSFLDHLVCTCFPCIFTLFYTCFAVYYDISLRVYLLPFLVLITTHCFTAALLALGRTAEFDAIAVTPNYSMMDLLWDCTHHYPYTVSVTLAPSNPIE